MNSNESRCIITKSVDLRNDFKSLLQRRYPDSPVRGGTFSDFQLAWLYNGPLLRIFDAATGTLISSWDFTSVTNDNRTEITNIIEYFIPESNRSSMKENQFYFIVSYTSKKDPTKASFISLCHPRTSRILHTITTKEKVTCLSLITARKDHSSPIAGIVKLMCGALAVGTTAGKLLVVDIKEIFTCARQGCVDRKQNRFSEMTIMEFKHNESNIKEKLNKSDEFHHVAVALPLSDRREIDDGDLKITALTYISQCTMLAVGLQNGAFQLWDVSTLKKLYRSSASSTQTPVVKFGFQEPCNDPQSFCYLWVLYESQNESNEILPFAIMYACLFKKITTVPEYGIHYKNFVHCKKRFDLDIDLERCISGRCIACSVVSNTPSNILRHVTSTGEEDPSKINLFVIVFETWEEISDCNSCITLITFDMNQWYKAQMPPVVYPGASVPFVNLQALEYLSERRNTIMDMRIKKNSIQQFLSFNLSEEYSYPSSLSFDTLVLTDSKLIHARLPGAQRNVLDKIVSEGPTGIINPNKYFSECKNVGLFPYFSDSVNHLFVPSQVQQRNFILTLLLEHKFSSFLVSCVKQWADGSRGVSGCTLPSLITWAWDSVTRIKQSTDTVCVPLFDYSGDDLDRENYQKLKHCVQLMHTIQDLLTYILKNYKQYLLEDMKLKHQVDTLKLITKYFDTIIWCLDCNLLPEKVTSSSEKCVPTYMMNLMQYTEQRRDELRNIVTKDKYFITDNTTLYIIDSILEQEQNGKKMRSQWEREGSGLSNGSYPPITLQSLLRMFLMPGFSTDAKHFIMIYFLLDVCDYHRDEDMKEQLLSFSVMFSIDSAFFSLVQACWFVDHEKFENATLLLLNDTVISQLKNRRELYRTILLACVCQGQYRMALRIEKLAKLSRTVFGNDSFSITVLLLNGLVMDAYFTMKENMVNQRELLRHFFKVCDNLGYLKEIFKFPLSLEEEEEFISYLDGCNNKDSGDLKVMYLLSRGRYVEAIDVNHNLSLTVPKMGIVGQDTTTQKVGLGRTTTRDMLVNTFRKTLPAVTNDLINFCRKERNKIARFKTVAKPTPLSVVVHTDTSHQIPVYASSFETVLEAAISKTAETWTNVPEILRRKRGQLDLKNTPFLKSALTTPRKNTSLYSERQRLSAVKEEKGSLDADEPPRKRSRKNISAISDDSTSERFSNDECDRMSPSAETSKILCTPHVQKRLNKLLQNTPESSPLTSILKSAESRFKQPQKVGFSVPEMNIRRSTRLNPSRSMSPPKIVERNTTGRYADQSVQSSDDSCVSSEKMDTSSSKSLNSSTTSPLQDSFYSLDSDSDGVCSMVDFIQEPSVRPPVFNFGTEVMSDEEMPPHSRTSSKLVIECMSEEETPSFNKTSTLTSESSSHEKMLPISQDSKRIVRNLCDEEKLVFGKTSSPVPGNVTKERTQQFIRASDFIESSIRGKETLLPTRLHFDGTASKPQTVHVEVHVPPPTIVDDKTKTEGETRAFANLQPLHDSPPYQIDSQETLCSITSFREEFSIDNYEKETVLEQSGQEVQTSNSDYDSDIEIVAESSPVKHAEREDFSDRSSESNENISEKTYESDYSYSHDSTQTETDGEEEEGEIQDVEDEAVNIDEEDEEEGISIQDEEEEEVEEEGCVEEVEESLEVQGLSEGEIDDEEEEDIVKAEESFEEKDPSDEADNESDGEKQRDLPNIDYDSLKEIMSAVNAAQARKVEPEVSDPSPSMVCHETTASVCEMVPTVSPEKLTKPSTLISAEQKEVTIVTSEDEVANQSNMSTEILSLSCLDKDQTADEPQMVFYFGENSVTSISENLLSDESMNQSQSEMAANVTNASQKSNDFSIVAVTEEGDAELDHTQDSTKVENKSEQSQNQIANFVEQSFTENSQNAEDFSIMVVTKEYASERGEPMEEQVEVSCGTSDSCRNTQIMSSCTVEKSSEGVLEKTRDFSVTNLTEKPVLMEDDADVDDQEKSSDHVTTSHEPEINVQQNFENIEIHLSSNPRIDILRESNSPNVSIGFVEETVDYSTHEIKDHSDQERTGLRPPELVPISVAEEMVVNVTYPSEDSSIRIPLEQPGKMKTGVVDSSNTKDSQEAESLEKLVTSNVQSSQFKSTSKTVTSEEYSPKNETLVQVQDAEIEIPLSSPGTSKGEHIAVGSHTPLPSTSSKEEIAETSKLNIAPSTESLAHKSPVRGTESECSFTMSIPDSPTGMLVMQEARTPSRRSARIARKQSTESIPQMIASETGPVVTQSGRRFSTDSVDAASVASDVSGADSVSSAVRKRSYSRTETRKSLMKPHFKQLKVIRSDEELSETSSTVDDDRLSFISNSSQRSTRRSTASKLNTAVLQTPSPPPKKRVLRELASATSTESPRKATPISQKTKTDGDYENYSDSRRLTRSQQKSLSEHGVTRVPTRVEPSPTPMDVAERDDMELGEKEQRITRSRTSSRLSKDEVPKSTNERLTKSGKILKRDDVILPADSDSSDDSRYSRTSTASQRAKKARRSTRTGTRLELRRSSVRPQFKPLTIVPSDEESISQSIAEDEPSPSSVRSKTTRSTKRTKKTESEVSDRESLHSDVSGSPSTRMSTRRTRLSIAFEESTKPTPKDQKSAQVSQRKRK